MVRGVEDSCYQRGYSLILCNTAGDEERMKRSLEPLSAIHQPEDELGELAIDTLIHRLRDPDAN